MNAADWFMVGLAPLAVVFSFFSMRFLRRSEREYNRLCKTICDNLTRIDAIHEQPTHPTIEEALRLR